MSKHHNIAVIGSGPGGYIAALKAAQMGASTVLIEESPNLGGTCLNNGCIPSKALLASAQLMHEIAHAKDLGVKIEGVASVDWPAVQKRKDRVLRQLRAGIKSLLAARGVTVLNGRGTLDGPGKISVALAPDKKKKTEGGRKDVTADKIILAVGSVPGRIPGWPTDPERVCTSDEALHWKTLPKSLMIVGGGVIGCEFACMMQPLGVRVAIVEMMPRLLPELDEGLGVEIKKILAKRGIAIYTDTKVEALTADGDSEEACKAVLSNGETVLTERVLVAVGRNANTENIGLQSVGLETDRGFIRVDDRMETSAKGIYCIGDANGRCLLAHAASAHGVTAVRNALGHENIFTAPIPGAVYTFPEIGTVGLTESEARERGIPVAIGNFPLMALGKAKAVGDTEGYAKVLRHRETGELLGVHILGHSATECIAAAGAMLHQKVSVEEMAEVVFAHPSMSESLKEAAEDALGEALHQPPRKILRIPVGE